MVLAMANVSKMPIVIFSSLENFPTIPILPRQQLHGMPSLFISFNAAGCGYYDYVCRENYLSEPEEKIGEEVKKKEKRANIECGAPRKRRKYDFQNLKKHTSQAYLHMKGEPSREGALTREEFFVVFYAL